MAHEATAHTGSAPAAPVPAAGTSGTKMIMTMGTLGLVCAVLIVAAFQLTQPAIERNKAAALERAVFDVIPGATSKVVFAEKDGRLVPESEAPGALRYFAGYDDNQRLVGVAVEASGQGFADLVKVIFGYAPDRGAIVGMKVLESHETPGLGTKIETDAAFRANFEALEVKLRASGNDIENPIVLVKPGKKTNPWEIEAITGATISSTAVTNILHNSTARTVPVIMNSLQTLEANGHE
ncbi:MAG: FMN-binding protein [Candidatus Krumholzibacteria bacterium]|nr:FMN-binding protein [Candidatus Krumholzibacteria bacterium]